MKYLILFLSVMSISLAQTARVDLGVQWDHVETATSSGYRIYEKVGTAWVAVAEVPKGSKTATLTNVSPGPKTYAVTALYGASESAKSETVSIIVPDLTPKNLRVNIVITLSAP